MPLFDFYIRRDGLALHVGEQTVHTPSGLRSVPFKMIVQVRKVRFHGRRQCLIFAPQALR
jgi:hypothetical protein